MIEGIQTRLYDFVIERALAVDPAAVHKELAWRQQRHPDETPLQLAERAVREYAMGGFVEGAATAMFTGPIFAVPAAVADAGMLMYAAARLNAIVGTLAEPTFMELPEWQAQVQLIVGDKPVATQTLRRTALTAVRSASTRLLTRGFTRMIPVIGGLVGGTWNALELRSLGRQMLKYHFPSPGPATTASQTSSDAQTHTEVPAEVIAQIVEPAPAMR